MKKITHIFLSASLFAQFALASSFNLYFDGDLDDDLIIQRATKNQWSFEYCLQMHNPQEFFYLEGKKTKSTSIAGWLSFDKNITLSSNEIIMISLANEREEINPEKNLLARTHYKSDPLFINGKKLIPGMNPDKNDLPDVPLWFGQYDDRKSYNYYNLWENATVNVGLVFSNAATYKISLVNRSGEVIASDDFYIDNKPKNIRFKNTTLGEIDTHPISEIDGGVHGIKNKFAPNDDTVKEHVPYKLLVQYNKHETIEIPFPYPFPYINRMFSMSIK